MASKKGAKSGRLRPNCSFSGSLLGRTTEMRSCGRYVAQGQYDEQTLQLLGLGLDLKFATGLSVKIEIVGIN